MIAYCTDCSGQDTGCIGSLGFDNKYEYNANVPAFLLELKAEINAQNRYGETALHKAIHGGKKEIVKILLDANADIFIENNRGIDPIQYALVKQPRNYVKEDNEGIKELMTEHKMKYLDEIKEKLKELNIYSEKGICGLIADYII